MGQHAVNHIFTSCGILAQYEKNMREVNFKRCNGT